MVLIHVEKSIITQNILNSNTIYDERFKYDLWVHKSIRATRGPRFFILKNINYLVNSSTHITHMFIDLCNSHYSYGPCDLCDRYGLYDICDQ